MISISALRRALKPTTEEDAQLPGLLSAVVAEWERETGWIWTPRTNHVAALNTIGMTTLLRLPLHTVASVATVREGQTLDALSTLESTSYALRPRNQLVRVGFAWAPWVEVTMTGGYADDAAPQDVLFAIRTQMEYARQMTAGEKLTNTSVGLAGATTSFRTQARHPLFMEALLRHRRLS